MHEKLLGCFCIVLSSMMDREAWSAAVYGVTMSQTRLSDRNELNWTSMMETESGIIWFSLTSWNVQILFISFAFVNQSKSNITIEADESKSESHSAKSHSVQLHGLHSPRNSPGPNIGVDSCSLLQGIFPSQWWNPGLPHCHWILDQLSHQGSLLKQTVVSMSPKIVIITYQNMK